MIRELFSPGWIVSESQKSLETGVFMAAPPQLGARRLSLHLPRCESRIGEARPRDVSQPADCFRLDLEIGSLRCQPTWTELTCVGRSVLGVPAQVGWTSVWYESAATGGGGGGSV